MTPAGWVFMLCSLIFVIGLNVFCFGRVLRKPATTEHMHAPLDVDTHEPPT